MTKNKLLLFKILFLGAIVVALVGLVAIAFYVNIDNMSELKEGKASLDFCSGKCQHYEVLTSNNNTEYKFIRCECLLEVKIDAHPISGARTKIQTVSYYFDSVSLQNITKKEVIDRIKTILP